MVKYTYKAQVSKLLMPWQKQEVTKIPTRVWYTRGFQWIQSPDRAESPANYPGRPHPQDKLRGLENISTLYPCEPQVWLFFYHWRGYYSAMTYLSIFNDINTSHKYVTIILHHQMLVIACLIKAVQFDLNKEFYHLTPSTWLILNNVIWKIFGSSVLSNFPIRDLGHFDLCWNQHIFQFGERKERMSLLIAYVWCVQLHLK